jgi:small subunit ribosomal protein S13
MTITFINRSVSTSQKIGKFLTTIYGISRYTAIRLCRHLGISYSMPLSDLTFSKKDYIETYFSFRSTGLDLQRLVQNNIANKVRFGGYTGLRISQNLPSRGQRSKTNAQTCKKRNRSVKKSVKVKK